MADRSIYPFPADRPWIAKGSLRLLQKAQLLTDRGRPFLGSARRRLRARAVTLNNLGCLMRKWGKPRVGIALLARAIRIEASVPGAAENPAGTHLNMSAALSSVGMHRTAAAHAVHAISLASEAIDACGGRPAEELASSTPIRTSSEDRGEDRDFNCSTLGDDGRGGDEETPPPFRSYSSSKAPPRFLVDDDTGGDQGTAETSEDDAVQGNSEGQKSMSLAGSILAIAYFNLAVEREHLGQQQAARAAYKHAKVAADWYLGPESPVSKGIINALESTTVDGISIRDRKSETPVVASFPSIGKLRLCPGSSLKEMRSRGYPSRHFRLLSERHTQDDSTTEYEGQNRLKRAYETPRPRPPPHQSPREATSSRPQRARRWISWRSSRGAQPPADVGWLCPWGETASTNDCLEGEEGLLWRALGCSDWGCSPMEARQAQLGGQIRSDRVRHIPTNNVRTGYSHRSL